MFHSARLKLTAWYLAIIMLISFSFSLIIYSGVDQELGRIERAHEARDERIQATLNQLGLVPSDIPTFDATALDDTRSRVIFILFLINIGILGVSGIFGYFLAGVTLKPIGDMVDEQNRFITDASHELRTPLTALKSEIEVALRDKKFSTKDARRLLTSNLEEVNKLQALSDGLIKLTQYKKDNYKVNFGHVSLKKVLDDAIKKVSTLSRDKQIMLKSQINDYKIPGESQSLVELFVILLDNAIKYSPEKSIIELKTIKDDGFVLVSVVDHGVGIKKSDIPIVFNRFYRGARSNVKNINGYGLGLSIAKQIVEKHNATINVTSEFGKGSTFTVKLHRK